MLSFVGKKTCCCWFYIADQLDKQNFYNTLRIKINSDMKENPIFDFQSAVVTSFHIKFKQLHIWGVSNTKGVKFNKHSKI